jgi:hypothetical protein
LFTRKKSIAVLTSILVLVGVAANGAGNLNTANSGGYLVCAKPENRIITHFANSKTAKCPKGFQKVSIGAQGIKGVPGLVGATGLSGSDGRDGKDGKTLWNGVKDPETTWGAPGDMFINATTKTLFGPKNLDGTWPAGVSMVGPKGDQGPIGLTGLTGAQGPGGSGPAGATGATGPAGATGATGPAGANGANGLPGEDGSDGQGPVYFKKVDSGPVTDEGSAVVILTLPAGSYLLTYSGIAVSPEGTEHLVDCAIDALPAFQFTSVFVGGGPYPMEIFKRIWLQEAFTFNSPTNDVVVVCQSEPGTGASMVSQTFTALRVSSVEDQSVVP